MIVASFLKRIPLVALGAVLFAPVTGAESPRPAQPNIVLLLADDLGWQDVKCYDIDEPSPMETPNLDALAKKGVMFWQAYSPAPVCAPSRAAILSGHHPARGEMTSVAGGSPPHPWHPTRAGTISPWFSARMPISTFTLAEALKAEGYATGHSGKWHISMNHYAYPNPFQHGFDYSVHDRGVQVPMKPDRLTGFATKSPKDPYRLDENGFPFDVPHQGALTFIEQNQDKPFFLYYATWLVHAPIVMRSEALLRKYEKKLGVKLTDEHKNIWKMKGQTNPFYCAMVEQFDYYMGQVINYLETTDDPRWPGHKLMENTYVIFSSDNGGMEGSSQEIYTDNYPLDRGKISTREGGVRVPLIITGPGIPTGVQTDVMANGLDFYPTILSLVGAQKPAGKIFDGCDLSPLLKNDPTDPTLVRDASGKVRDTMLWHFPQAENTSSIRVGDYKLVRSYRGTTTPLALFRLYDSADADPARVDIEEMKDLADSMPEKTAELNARLTEILAEMGGRTPYFNPNYAGDIPQKEKAPKVLSHQQTGRTVTFSYQNNGAKIAFADLIYTPNGGDWNEEWLRVSATLQGDNKVVAELPEGTSHYFLNLIDENNFLAIYPEIDKPKLNQTKARFSTVAIFAGYPQLTPGEPIDLKTLYAQRSIAAEGEAVLLRDDFEDPSACAIKVSAEGLSIADSVAASGKRSLRLFDAAGLTHDWMPLADASVTIPKESTFSTFLLACDVMLDKVAPGRLSVMLRDYQSIAPAHADLASIVMGDGALKVDGLAVVVVQPGVWYHLEITGRFGSSTNRMLTVSATTADGHTARREIPCGSIHFGHPTWIGLAGVGTTDSVTYVDNLVLRTDTTDSQEEK